MKPSPFLLNRARRLLPLTTKTAPRGFYKGTRTGSMGRHTRWGGYIVDFDKVRHYVVPEASADFKLTPFVTNRIKPMRGSYGSKENQPGRGEYYLQRWKDENGED